MVVYLRGHEGRGIGLVAKLQAYELQDGGRDTVDANLDLGLPADARHYGTATQVLRDLGVSRVRLLTNNPDKTASLEDFGIDGHRAGAARACTRPSTTWPTCAPSATGWATTCPDRCDLRRTTDRHRRRPRSCTDERARSPRPRRPFDASDLRVAVVAAQLARPR